MQVAIYTDSNWFDLYWLNQLNLPQDYCHYHIMSDYIDSTADVKIAFTTERFCLDYETETRIGLNKSIGFPYHGFEEKILKLSSVSDCIFSFDGELHDHYFDIWDKCDSEKVYWVFPGHVNNISERVIRWYNWFTQSQHIYTNLVPLKLTEIKTQLPKQYYFDALLGRVQPHRDFLWRKILNSPIKDKLIATYNGDRVLPDSTTENFIWEKNLKPDNSVSTGTHCRADYYGHDVPISAIIPIDVYNQTAYSIIAETNHNNAYSFYTEKTSKPIIARRLFVAFSGQHFLRNLQSGGFKTFDGIIDESYDQIEDPTIRWNMAFEQVERLCNMDQFEVYQQVKNILEHNFNLLVNTDWIQHAVIQIQNKIDTYLN
jgi:hypothetical protein